MFLPILYEDYWIRVQWEGSVKFIVYNDDCSHQVVWEKVTLRHTKFEPRAA